MASKGTLTIKILGDSKPLEKTLKGTGSKLGKFVAGVAAAGVAAGGLLVKNGIEAAREATKINRLTEQVLESTKGAANVSIAEIEKLNGALQATTGVSDEVIQEGQNLLLTFTNIKNEVGEGNDIFDQATEAALDMSVALGTDMKSGSIQLGKALNDPIKGITALSRAGVSFTEQQKEQIKTLTESGDVLGAQKVILGELETQFGGAAEAAADPMQKLQATIGDVVEVVGMELLPIVNGFATWAAETLPGAMEKTVAFAKEHVIPIFVGIGTTIAAVTGFFQDHQAAVVAVVAVLSAAMAAWATAATISAAKTVVAWVTTATAATAAGATTKLTAGQTVLKWAWMGAQALLHAAKVAAAWVIAMGPVALVIAAVVGLVALIIANWDTIRRVTVELWNTVKEFTSEAWEKIKGAVKAAADWLVNLFLNWTLPGLVIKHFDAIVAFVTELPRRIAAAASGMWDGIKDAFKSAVNWIIGKWNDLQLRIGGGSFDLPGPLGSVTIPSITLDTPNIPMLAKGGTALSPGLAIVGESGPELVNLNRGATVQPLSPADRPDRPPIHVTVDAPNYIGDHHDLARLFESQLAKGIRRAEWLAGLT